jgi:hypothetical protein
MVTIISVTKNDFEGICKTILSTRPFRDKYNFKQIIIDSSDQLIKEKINVLIQDHSNIEYLWSAPKGISNAFNIGINAAKNEWVWFLNGGDTVHIEFPEEILPKLVSKTSADFLIFQIEYSKSKIIRAFPPIWLQWPPLISWIPHPSMLIRKKVFADYGMFDERFKLAMDYDFWLRTFSKNTKLDLVSIPLTLFDEDGLSSVLKKKGAREVLKSLFYRSFTIIKSLLVNWLLQIRMIFQLIKQSI